MFNAAELRSLIGLPPKAILKIMKKRRVGCNKWVKKDTMIVRVSEKMCNFAADMTIEEIQELIAKDDAEEELCKFMRYLRQEPVLLQVLSHEELEIDDTGAARLHDIEIPEEMVSATFDRITVDGYLEALKEFTTRLKLSADRAGAGYYLCRTDRTIGRILLEDLRGLYDI